MKKLNLKLFITSLLFVITLGISSGSVFAQSGRVMSVEIPFSFHVNNTEFPSGNYKLTRISDVSFLIRKEDGSKKAIISTPATFRIRKEVSDEKVVFNRYGDTYFLRQIFSNRIAEGYGLSESKSEKNMRKSVSENLMSPLRKSSPEEVSIGLKTN